MVALCQQKWVLVQQLYDLTPWDRIVYVVTGWFDPQRQQLYL